MPHHVVAAALSRPQDGSLALALGITAVAVVVAGRVVGAVRAATVPSLIVGRDGRTSTTTTVAAAWTVVLLWFVVALVFRPPTSWAAVTTAVDPASAALVAAPFVTAVLARVVVVRRIATGSLQKPVAIAPRWSDLVSDDEGAADLVDLQYVLFNGAAIAFVVVRFLGGVSEAAPAALTALTALPGAVLVVGKVAHGNRPVITSATPFVVTPGQRFTVFGRNLLAGTGGADARISATVDGRDALVVLASDTSAVILTPSAEGQVSVRVVTTAGAVAVLPGALTVVRSPPAGGPSASSAP